MKRFNRTLAFVLTLAFTAGSAWSASPTSTLKELRKRYREIKSLQAGFKEVFRWELTGETSVREGTLIVTQGNRFRLESPEQILTCNGAVVKRWNRLRNQVILESAEGAGERFLPSRLLLDLPDRFEAIRLENLPVEGLPGFRLDLKSHQPEEDLLRELSLWATAEDLLVRRLKVVDLDGNSTVYSLSNLRLNPELPDSLFEGEVPPDAEVFDLR